MERRDEEKKNCWQKNGFGKRLKEFFHRNERGELRNNMQFCLLYRLVFLPLWSPWGMLSVWLWCCNSSGITIPNQEHMNAVRTIKNAVECKRFWILIYLFSFRSHTYTFISSLAKLQKRICFPKSNRFGIGYDWCWIRYPWLQKGCTCCELVLLLVIVGCYVLHLCLKIVKAARTVLFIRKILIGSWNNRSFRLKLQKYPLKCVQNFNYMCKMQSECRKCSSSSSGTYVNHELL